MINLLHITFLMPPKRALSVTDLLNMKFKTMNFTGAWADFVGEPEEGSLWIVYGNSGNGKTRFSLSLAKYLTQFGRVAYNTLEEGAKASFQKAVRESNLREVAKKLIILSEGIEDLKLRLRKNRCPNIVIVDSLQFAQLNKSSFMELVAEFKKVTWVFISHAEGKKPEGRLAKSVEYKCDVKIRIEGYRAFSKSRYGGGKHIDIWPEKAAEYYGEIAAK